MILPRDQKDPLIGTLPPAPNTTGSPALAGQPPAITGQGPTPAVPTTSGQPPMGGAGQPALAPAPSPGGTAQVGGAPLSGNEPEIPQDGAGANLDLVKDRGTPDEFWSSMLMEMGSKNALQALGQSAYGSSFSTGQLANEDPEEARRMGVRMNTAFGMNTPEQQDAMVNDMIYRPMLSTMMAENQSGVIDDEEMLVRATETVTQVEGAESEEQLRANMERSAELLEEEGVEIDEEEREGIFKRAWGRVKEFWQRGLDDPSTPEDESQETYYVDPATGKEVEAGTAGAEERTRDAQVTKFMGGMTRQELGMFVFQWGALMMQNSEQGFGGAMGTASLGALEGHQQRGTSALAAGLEERQVAAQEKTAEAAMQRAQQGTQPKVTVVGDGIMYWDSEQNKLVYAMDEDGNKIPPPASSANRPYAAQELASQLEQTGFFTPEEIALLSAGQPGRGEVADSAMDAWERRLAKDIYPDGMRLSDWRAKPELERERLKREFVDRYVQMYMNTALPAATGAGALPNNGEPTAEDGAAAVDQYADDE